MANEKRLIDANELMSNIHFYDEQQKNDVWLTSDIEALLAEQPTVDAVEVVHGRWIHCQGKSNLWYCSECGEKILYNPTRRTYNIEKRPVHEVNKYCRGCGAIMDGGNDDGICKES